MPTNRSGNPDFIKLLFSIADISNNIGNVPLEFIDNNYNKKPGCALIDATDDAEAIASVLTEYKNSPETLRSYTKEIERLLLWCVRVSKTNISNLRRDHLTAYQDFIKHPTPKKCWCGPSVSRTKKEGTINFNLKPFVKGLGSNSLLKTIRIFDSFFNYLVQMNYLIGNPLAVDHRRKKRNPVKPRLIDRYLALNEVQAVLEALSQYPAKDDINNFQAIRAKYIILLLFYSGLRITEAANQTMENFIQREGNWFLRVPGKGKNLKQLIGIRRIDQILKWAFNLGANQFEPKQPQKASKLREASAHWLRHSYVTYLLDAGEPPKVAQKNAGHSEIGTTMLYCRVAKTDRFEAIRTLSLKKKARVPNKDET
jgi:site-specific recombinase XerD